MRPFGAAALVFTLVIFTECLAAHSDRSRQRSGPIRSVPVAADIKRDIDFDCPEEFGYYPHPTDCTLYYVCVFGGALLESCTGGLMYSHELQTCDWPRNVGCDTATVIGGDELERLNEREPPPPPRRTPPPPPPPRAQPNPVVTSRGQPKFSREEYEKQQQLYAEVDDLPPVEEIESDRQQRVYRGQPSTIGQVQKDRDGYVSQVVSSGRNLNSNIIPASISQSSGKIGSFSFGSQIDERRTVTQAPQTYSETKSDNVTDYSHDRQSDIETNDIDVTDKATLTVRKKRETMNQNVGLGENNSTIEVSEKSDIEKVMDYFEVNTSATSDNDNSNEYDDDEISPEDMERGKRQVRYYLKNGYNTGGKYVTNSKPIKFVDVQLFNYKPNIPNNRYQPAIHGVNNNNFYDGSRNPNPSNILFSTANSFAYQTQNNQQSERPFKPSQPDPSTQRLPHNPMNSATQIITKSPPISSLKNNENPFSALSGGFKWNMEAPIYMNNNPINKFSSQIESQSNNQAFSHDSSHLPSTVITAKPSLISTSPRTHVKYRLNSDQNNHNGQSKKIVQTLNVDTNQKENDNKPLQNKDYVDEEDKESSEEDSYESDEGNNKHNFNHDFPEPPFEFTHPRHKYAEIENPFADPNFNFDTFIAKLRDDHYSAIVQSTTMPRSKQNASFRLVNTHADMTTPSNLNSALSTSTLGYKGMSTPQPFTVPVGLNSAIRALINSNPLPFAKPGHPDYLINQQQFNNQQLRPSNQNDFGRIIQQNAGTPLEAVRPKLKPPNFKDDRQLPISYNFNKPIESTSKPQTQLNGETQQILLVNHKPYLLITTTGAPIVLSTPKHQYYRPEKIVSLQPDVYSSGKPYLTSTVKSQNAFIAFKQSTSKPLTTLANEQLSALQHYWKNPFTESHFTIKSTIRPEVMSELPKLESFTQTSRPSVQSPVKNLNISNISQGQFTSTTRLPVKRKPILKPSPEMNDYYYDDDDQYYYEPAVKSKYMPSSEVRPQRPPMAQNDHEYDDYEDSNGPVVNIQSPQPKKVSKRPVKYIAYKSQSATKNHNDVSVVTKAPLKESTRNINVKIPVPAMINLVTPTPTMLMRPEVSNYEIVHTSRNTTTHIRKPMHSESGPYTVKPPKYLNQTTLRPYTVRHRLAKPTTTTKGTSAQNEEVKQTRGRTRHQNIVAQMKFTTPRDSHNQETRYTKTKHDDKTNSLEPTESVSPVSYSASPRPKMLYNGSQSYTPEQYDPYYAVYDEDGELYKDTDYVQQYNTASLRPAVQQTYRGTPPPRRPVETYTPRPSPDDYDDALIQGQINNQNQYQSPVRHSTRGEGNELGYYHIPSSVRTPAYEATTSLRTTPSTTSTSTTTTTQRSTTAPFTEAMTPARHTPRSSTDENPIKTSESSLKYNLTDSPDSFVPSTPSSIINFSSLAKPFEKTDNSNRLKQTLPSTEKIASRRISAYVTNTVHNNVPVEVVRPTSNRDNKKVVSLTTGFSIRRNGNNTNNPYTLTVLTRPFDDYQKFRKSENKQSIFAEKEIQPDRYYYENDQGHRESFQSKAESYLNNNEKPIKDLAIRQNIHFETIKEHDDNSVPVRRPSIIRSTTKPKIKSTTEPTTTTKYYLKTVIRRPAPFSQKEDQNESSTENTIDTETLINSSLQNVKDNNFQNLHENNSRGEKLPQGQQSETEDKLLDEPVVSPYRTLNNLRHTYSRSKDNLDKEFTTSTTSTTRFTTTTPKVILDQNTLKIEKISMPQQSYYSYQVEDVVVPDQTTEIFSGKAKSIIKSFYNNFSSSSKPEVSNTTPSSLTTAKVVNIGYQKKTVKYNDEKPLRANVKHLQIITEPSTINSTHSNVDISKFIERNGSSRKPFFSTTTATTSTTTLSSTISPTKTTTPIPYEVTQKMQEISTNNHYSNILSSEMYDSKFNTFVTSNPNIEITSKFYKIIEDDSSIRKHNVNNHINEHVINNLTNTTENEATKTTTELEQQIVNDEDVNEIASTTSTTKATTTTRVKTTPIKSLSFPTRPSRVNPAIKLAATMGSERRSYQSSSKCSTDNSLQANPKCNEIKYQRPTGTRGRGSAHYSTLNGSEASQQQQQQQQQQQTPNRGTPPTRSRPTLKPSTAIVSKSTEFVDVYTHPPSRPAPVYPQPTPDKTAAKCRKDVCLLPDCYCGGKDIPGDLPVETVPQIVLLTFDDSVNDLNKGLYADLFEKGRVNPNGCPISATFYVSHEWTDYSQVQNLYSAGHEMASHTISHSFGEQFSQKKWNREVGGQREILAAYGGVKLEDVRGMRAPFLSVGGNKMFKMLYDSNFTYDSSLPVYENRPPSWPYTLDYKLFHDCMIPPCPTKSYPGVWEVPMVMWQDLNGGRCSMGDACANPPEAEGVYKMLLKNFDRHYTTNRAPFGLFYHAAWFTQPHHKEGFIMFLDFINSMKDVWIVTNWQALQWVRDPTPISRLNNFQPFQCNYQDRPKKCNNPKVCNLWHKSGVRYMRTCQPCPEVYPWTGKTGIKSSRIDNDIDD